MNKKYVAIIGGGVAGVMLAAHLDKRLFDIVVYEKNTALGRKFLVAGDGGLNLTHSENIDTFLLKYNPTLFLKKAVMAFDNQQLRNWLHTLGVETIIGSSKRVFPQKGIKPITVLNTLIKELTQKGVTIKTKHACIGFNNHRVQMKDLNTDYTFDIKPDVVVFALGGASWSVTGSDGKWSDYFTSNNIQVVSFQPSNCAFKVEWDANFIKEAEGKFLKNITVRCGSEEKKGELVITKFGLEGGAIYALSGSIRKQLNEFGVAKISIDLKPAYTIAEIHTLLTNRKNKSLTQRLVKDVNLSLIQVKLLKSILTKEEFMDLKQLAFNIKQLPINITQTGPIDEAISTVGGIALSEIDENFQLKKMPNHYVLGEMLDWDAPTGGYLLQACFSMGYYLADVLNKMETHS